MPQFFRYEKQQRGRLREFYQFNADIIGEASPAADAEMIGLIIDLLRGFGLKQEDFVVRVSDRRAWAAFAKARGVAEDQLLDFLAVVDKLERNSPEESAKKLGEFGIAITDLKAFIADPASEAPTLKQINEELTARGLDGFVEMDLTIVRGLAYYTGFVFEVFDRSKKERALAGGGRYDNLLALMSDGKVDLPALGFGMGDVVLANLINDTPHAKAKMDAWLAENRACEIYTVIAKEERRTDALAIVQQLRNAGLRVDFPLSATKVGKQFQAAEQLGARFVILFGDEWPQVKIKTLASREETLVSREDLISHIAHTTRHSEHSEESPAS